MVISCDIKFDQNSYGIYFAGQVLSGRVDINLDKPKKVKGVCLKIAGYAQCNWTENDVRHNRQRQRRVITYSGRDDYISTSTYLVGSEMGNQIEIPPGTHTYSFACALPAMLPTSFEGTYGHVRYTVRVILERPWKFDQSYKVAFTVLKEFDLNYDSPILRIPTQMEITNRFWCGVCTTGPLSMMTSIPQSGYVPGQKVIVTTEVANMSNIRVDHMKFMLRKIISYHSQTPFMKTKIEAIVIQQHRTGGVLTKDHGRFQVVLSIPPVPPTNTNLCKVIHINYEVKVEAKISGPHHSPSINIPITVGTIPLNRNIPDPKAPLIQTHVQPITAQPSYSIVMPMPERQIAAAPTILTGRETMPPSYTGQSGMTSVQPITDALTNRNATEYPDMPPPSYEESLNGNSQIEDAEDLHPIGHQPYTPRYPVYNFDQPEVVPGTAIENVHKDKMQSIENRNH